MRAFFIGPVVPTSPPRIERDRSETTSLRGGTLGDRSNGAFGVKYQHARASRTKDRTRCRRHAGSWTSGAMTGPGHGRIRAVAMDGNSEDASLRAPGRNERRSAGHGKRRARRCHAAKTIQGRTHVNAFQRLPVPAAMAVASSGVGSGKRFSNSKAAKRKKAAWVSGTRDRRRPRTGRPVAFIARTE